MLDHQVFLKATLHTLLTDDLYQLSQMSFKVLLWHSSHICCISFFNISKHMNEDIYIKQFQSIQINNSESTKDDRDKKTMRGMHIKCMK